jgi:hypothetical protein
LRGAAIRSTGEGDVEVNPLRVKRLGLAQLLPARQGLEAGEDFAAFVLARLRKWQTFLGAVYRAISPRPVI